MNVVVDISVDPISGFSRKVSVEEFYVSLNKVQLVTKCSFYDGATPVTAERYKPYTIVLTAENSTMVNPVNGNSVEDGEAEEDCTQGEYDYFNDLADSPINIFDIMAATITKADTRGRYNN